MQSIYQKITDLFLKNNTWLFLTIIFFISFNWVMNFRDFQIGSLVYLAKVKWMLYLRFACSLCFLFAPVLILKAFEGPIQQFFGKRIYQLIWIYSFLIHPFLLSSFEINQFFKALTFSSEMLIFFGLALLLVELLVLANNFLIKKLNIEQWFKKVSLEKGLLLLMLSFSFLFASLATYILMQKGNNKYGICLSLMSRFFQVFIFLGIIYLFYFINRFFLIQKVLNQKGILYYIFAFITLALIFYPLFALSIYYSPIITFQWFMGPQYWRPKGEMTEYFSAIPAYLPWIWMALTIPFIFIYQWWKQKSDIANLQKEKYKAELAVLKQQINPHFLFNTLNALYALGIEEKGNKTADGIAKLGTLMRYNLHDAQIDYIDLKKELDYIRKYIGLQQLRITDKDELSVSIMEVEGKQLQIAPMLLLPFIENAFKFGISPTHSTFIRLSIQLNHKQLEMNIANSILKNENKQTGFGMGITNVKKRLNLLYPNQHELTIEKTATTFKVHLSIDLKNLHFNE